ncbi:MULTISPECIES: hypothetical protein [unclassified Oceanispirochaeta]|uniref:hypothetical protein n=1 Tax=unclassified Oceanispirochaeta TaxID=2635722 RepID=UPI000E08F138|nr:MULTISPECIES: hypothetical protein [unclassified Oceanispirochaeta]MBF9014789.1 hypothetical protein [Oceanispirochaeta sp. M2]NPD71045.1 hypothetical protein [Oceanispirochaeta sp. M1]RDG33878.1 hypothetical protein DV872_02935 [Oceanispirochaeta sp. M1]
MSRYSLILLLVFIPLVSCKSLPQSEQPPQNEVFIPRVSGEISSLEIIDGQLIIQSDGEIRIAYTLDTEKSRFQLENAESYRYNHMKRPDGPISDLTLYKGEEQIAWISEGLREGAALDGLSVLPAADTDSIILKSKDQEWPIPADTETVVNWGDGDYIAYASQISKGKMEDQPPFRVNLILLKR